jgi:hypothetical protein
MDFIIGILLTIVIILVLVNFTSVSLSDSNNPNSQQCGSSSLFSSLGLGSISGLGNSGLGNGGYNQPPQPIVASAPSALNKKVNLEQQTYDYNKYFFIT